MRFWKVTWGWAAAFEQLTKRWTAAVRAARVSPHSSLRLAASCPLVCTCGQGRQAVRCERARTRTKMYMSCFCEVFVVLEHMTVCSTCTCESAVRGCCMLDVSKEVLIRSSFQAMQRAGKWAAVCCCSSAPGREARHSLHYLMLLFSMSVMAVSTKRN